MAVTAVQTPPRHRWKVFRALTAAEIKEERDLTATGLLRWTIEPLSYMVVYMVVLGAILNRPRPNFPLFLLAALIPFRFFTEAINRAMGVVKSHSAILTNRIFPREVLPLVVVASNAATLVLSLLLLVPFMIALDVPFHLSLLWVPVILAILLILTLGPTYLAALIGLYFPDFRGPVQNLVRMSFFLSTGLFTLRDVPGKELPLLIQANPLSSIFDSFRAVILQGRTPDRVDLLYPLALGLFVLAVGLYLYRWRQDQFAKEV